MPSSHIQHHGWSQCWMAEGEWCFQSSNRSRLQPFLLGHSVFPVTHFSPHHHSHLALHPDCPTSGPIQLAPDPSSLPYCASLACSVSDTGTTLHPSSHTRSLVWIFLSMVYIPPTLEFCQFYFLNISGLHCPQSQHLFPMDWVTARDS